VLEREGDDILEPFDGDRQRVSRKTLTDDNLDPSNVVVGIPVILVEQLLTEVREPKWLELACLCAL